MNYSAPQYSFNVGNNTGIEFAPYTVRLISEGTVVGEVGILRMMAEQYPDLMLSLVLAGAVMGAVLVRILEKL